MIWKSTLREESQEFDSAKPVSFGRALLNPIVLIMVGIYLMQNCGNYGYLFWLPSALENAKKMSNQLVESLRRSPLF